MPIKTPSNPPLPMERLQALRGSQPAAFFDKFIVQGSADNTYDGRSIYVPKPMKNGISEPGAIFINPHDVTSLANAIGGIPYLKYKVYKKNRCLPTAAFSFLPQQQRLEPRHRAANN